MALTPFQRSVCKLLAQDRIASGESYVAAGGAALNELLGAPRLSRDVDLFHDTERALDASWAADRALLEGNGYVVRALRERASFVEAEVTRGPDSLLLQWARDSAYRFFPLVEHAELGLVLHPFDLATNKMLALVGRLEVRDWVDIVECDERRQQLGYLAWAACGKDLGFSPLSILEHAARNGHYSPTEVGSLAFEGKPPDAVALASRFRGALEHGHELIGLLPAEHVGKCIVSESGQLYRGALDVLGADLQHGRLRFHAGSIRGAWPELVAGAPR